MAVLEHFRDIEQCDRDKKKKEQEGATCQPSTDSKSAEASAGMFEF